jgi:excisionase family DNA binding protein
MTTTMTPPPDTEVAMLTLDDLGKRWNCSVKHARRLVDSGRAPAGVKLGRLRRFPLAAIEAWEAAGCPRVKSR